MGRKEKFSIHEAVILLSYYIEVLEGSISRTEAIKLASDVLRKMACNQGYDVDETFRNITGITFQMHSMESAYKGYTVFKEASQLFLTVVDLYKYDRYEFKRILNEAFEMVTNESIQKDEVLKKEIELKKSQIEQKIKDIFKIYGTPKGLHINKITELVGSNMTKEIILEMIEEGNLAISVYDDCYILPCVKNTDNENKRPLITEEEKQRYINILENRFESGMEFDSVDLEIFRDLHIDYYHEDVVIGDDALIEKLKLCGIVYNDRIFPAKGILDDNVADKLYTYIDSQFNAGVRMLYYKAIFSDLKDVFICCFNLVDEKMLRKYIEYTAKEGDFFFHEDFITKEKDVQVNHDIEIEEFLLSVGKPSSYDEIYKALSHISREKIYASIRNSSKFILNGRESYFHEALFECSNIEMERISNIISCIIDEEGYAIWKNAYEKIKDEMPMFIEHNSYLSSLGIRNAVSKRLNKAFSFEGAVVSKKENKVDMASVFKMFAVRHRTFSIDDLYNLAKELDTTIYYDAISTVAVRVSHQQFVVNEMIKFDVEQVDNAIGSYMADDYMPIKDIDSYLIFPNVGYEWNQYLLESYLHAYSNRFKLLNNGRSRDNVAGAVAERDCKIDNFNDVCALALANSPIELKTAPALNYLADINFITRRSYREIDTAIAKARVIRNGKEQ